MLKILCNIKFLVITRKLRSKIEKNMYKENLFRIISTIIYFKPSKLVRKILL